MPAQFINPVGLPVSLSYTQIVAVNKSAQTIYIAGQVSLDRNGKLVAKDDMRGQTIQVYENLNIALQAVGATFDDVVKTTIYVVNTDAEKFNIVREIRAQYQTGPNPPANTYIGVQGLASDDFMIEIEAIVASG